MEEKEFKYSADHVWVQDRGGGVARVGVTLYYLDRLATIRIVEIVPEGTSLARGETMATLESSKAAFDLPSPLGGKIKSVNQAVTAEPELINRDPSGEGWLVEIGYDNPGELGDLLTGEDYQKMAFE